MRLGVYHDFCIDKCHEIILNTNLPWPSVQFSHLVMSEFCDPIDCSTTGLPVHHQFPEFTPSHVH